MTRYVHEAVRYAPLFRLTFRLAAPRRFREAQEFVRKNRHLEEIDGIPGRLRWLRHERGLMQKEVAEYVGISRAVYVGLESGLYQAFPLPVMDRLSEYYAVPLSVLLDEYNRFLLKQPAQKLLAYRKRTGMSRREFAEQTGVPESSLRDWEQGKKTISRASWERYFRDPNSPCQCVLSGL